MADLPNYEEDENYDENEDSKPKDIKTLAPETSDSFKQYIDGLKAKQKTK